MPGPAPPAPTPLAALPLLAAADGPVPLPAIDDMLMTSGEGTLPMVAVPEHGADIRRSLDMDCSNGLTLALTQFGLGAREDPPLTLKLAHSLTGLLPQMEPATDDTAAESELRRLC